MLSINRLKPLQRFRIPSLGLSGYLIHCNACRAHVSIDGQGTSDWSPLTIVVASDEVLAVAPQDAPRAKSRSTETAGAFIKRHLQAETPFDELVELLKETFPTKKCGTCPESAKRQIAYYRSQLKKESK